MGYVDSIARCAREREIQKRRRRLFRRRCLWARRHSAGLLASRGAGSQTHALFLLLLVLPAELATRAIKRKLLEGEALQTSL